MSGSDQYNFSYFRLIVSCTGGLLDPRSKPILHYSITLLYNQETRPRCRATPLRSLHNSTSTSTRSFFSFASLPMGLLLPPVCRILSTPVIRAVFALPSPTAPSPPPFSSIVILSRFCIALIQSFQKQPECLHLYRSRLPVRSMRWSLQKQPECLHRCQSMPTVWPMRTPECDSNIKVSRHHRLSRAC